MQLLFIIIIIITSQDSLRQLQYLEDEPWMGLKPLQPIPRPTQKTSPTPGTWTSERPSSRRRWWPRDPFRASRTASRRPWRPRSGRGGRSYDSRSRWNPSRSRSETQRRLGNPGGKGCSRLTLPFLNPLRCTVCEGGQSIKYSRS